MHEGVLGESSELAAPAVTLDKDDNYHALTLLVIGSKTFSVNLPSLIVFIAIYRKKYDETWEIHRKRMGTNDQRCQRAW